ncbi:hypothetical protein G6321_00030970 [Bradyrhizobium barranii subsp. barranii]|uniref:Uncharacterized protein n=1 Tax=Bradyrhizobium barranii subsp. barranii TaxID=2823807 RepID=A0A7Z0TPW3_9BRAD|nr:hypothetical protein [Bradyrhizobium barranii]UGX90257.1 hypothetical protein G6321_00030970 [Bradyrhizobium barranii subsp. barranii]
MTGAGDRETLPRSRHNRRRALNVISYPLHLCRKFDRRWSAKAVQDETQQSPSQRPNGCTACGRIVAAPLHATYLPTGNCVNQWRCPVCKNSWQTSADATSSTDIQLSPSEHLRQNAGHCLTLEDTAANDAARKQFRSMGDAWLALAETQEWLDGATPPVSRPQPQSADLIPMPTQGRSS